MSKQIALDTGVARACCYAEPQWLAAFVAMGKEGWSFHLTDICGAESIAAFERGSISGEEWNLCSERLKTFVSDWLPLLPGKRQLFHLCGFEDLEDPNKEQDSVEFREEYSKAVWQMLQQLALPPEAQEEISFGADGERFECDFKSGAAKEELDSERSKWVAEMKRDPKEDFDYESEIAEIRADFDQWATTSDLPMSVRGDILAHAQAEWEKRIASGYSPVGKKHRNDGIDFLLHFAFMWPALLVTTDKDVHRFLRGLGSFQASWIYTPDELAEGWKNGQLAEPNWP